MPHNPDCLARLATPADLEKILAWRNRPDVRANMLTQHEISLAEHRQWFERSLQDQTRSLLIVEENHLQLGFVHFSGVAAGAIANWGFYAAPDVARGTGLKIGMAALAFAYETLALHKVCGQALAFNIASIRTHEKLGFRQEGTLRQQHRINDTYHDLVCFGLLQGEWQAELGHKA